MTTDVDDARLRLARAVHVCRSLGWTCAAVEFEDLAIIDGELTRLTDLLHEMLDHERVFSIAFAEAGAQP